MNQKHILRLAVIVGLSCALSLPGVAQIYSGPTGTAGGATGSAPSYGNKGAAIGAAAGAGAGAVALLLLVRHHRHATTAMVGCVGQDGKTFTTDKGNHAFAIAGDSLTPGEHLEVRGKRAKSTDNQPVLDMLAVQKDLGQCQSNGAAAGGGSN